MAITRRQFLIGSALSAASLALWPAASWATPAAAADPDARFIFVLLRGGLDGLQSTPPYGDPGYQAIRGPLALSPSAEHPAHRLDEVFALHPAFKFASELYAKGEFAPVVAAAPPYWGRSHFQAQDCVENGMSTPSGGRTGWLNRCLAARSALTGLACANVMPMAMQGPAVVESWSPPLPAPADAALLRALAPLYQGDARLTGAFSQLLAEQDKSPLQPVVRAALAREGDARDWETSGPLPLPLDGGPTRMYGTLAVTLGAAGSFMRAADGPRVAFVENDGWDTHAREAFILDGKLAELDAGLKVLHEAIGPQWARTVVVIATEFGRTAQVNGNGGTDHGTGGSIFLAGGAVAGGRVIGDWPGVGKRELFEQRDVHATTDYRSVFKGVLAQHLGFDEATLEASVFPDSAKAKPMEGLIRRPATA